MSGNEFTERNEIIEIFDDLKLYNFNIKGIVLQNDPAYQYTSLLFECHGKKYIFETVDQIQDWSSSSSEILIKLFEVNNFNCTDEKASYIVPKYEQKESLQIMSGLEYKESTRFFKDMCYLKNDAICIAFYNSVIVFNDEIYKGLYYNNEIMQMIQYEDFINGKYFIEEER